MSECPAYLFVCSYLSVFLFFFSLSLTPVVWTLHDSIKWKSYQTWTLTSASVVFLTHTFPNLRLQRNSSPSSCNPYRRFVKSLICVWLVVCLRMYVHLPRSVYLSQLCSMSIYLSVCCSHICQYICLSTIHLNRSICLSVSQSVSLSVHSSVLHPSLTFYP